MLVAAKIDIEVHRAKDANFEVIKTYTWLPSPPPTTDVAPGLMRDPKVVQQELDPIIVGAVDAEFTKRGLRRVADGGDVQVVYYLAHGTDMVASTMGSYYQYATDFYVGGSTAGRRRTPGSSSRARWWSTSSTTGARSGVRKPARRSTARTTPRSAGR